MKEVARLFFATKKTPPKRCLSWLCGLDRGEHSPFTHPFAMRMQQDVQIYIEVKMT